MLSNLREKQEQERGKECDRRCSRGKICIYQQAVKSRHRCRCGCEQAHSQRNTVTLTGCIMQNDSSITLVKLLLSLRTNC